MPPIFAHAECCSSLLTRIFVLGCAAVPNIEFGMHGLSETVPPMMAIIRREVAALGNLIRKNLQLRKTFLVTPGKAGVWFLAHAACTRFRLLPE